MLVPIPTLPDDKMVTFAESDGPIMVEFAVLLVIELPKAEAPEADAVLLYPKAEELSAEALLLYPKAEAFVAA